MPWWRSIIETAAKYMYLNAAAVTPTPSSRLKFHAANSLSLFGLPSPLNTVFVPRHAEMFQTIDSLCRSSPSRSAASFQRTSQAARHQGDNTTQNVKSNQSNVSLIEQLSDRNCKRKSCNDKIQDDKKWIQSILSTTLSQNNTIRYDTIEEINVDSKAEYNNSLDMTTTFEQ